MRVLVSDFGSDPLVGLIFVGVTIVFYVVWALVDEKGMYKHHEEKVWMKHGETGARTERNRRKRHNKRRNQVNRLRGVTSPNTDGQYVYIMESMGIYKVGISNNPDYRNKQIIKELNGQGVAILYIGSAKYGRTIDAEQIIHSDLAPYKVDVIYRNGVNSVEWFDAPLNVVLNKVEEYCDMTVYH